MSFSRKSREAEAFDKYRLDLMRRSVPVSKTPRKEWETKFKEFVEAALPEQKLMFQKPGLASRLFSAEVELVDAHPRDLEAISQHLDVVWSASQPKETKSQMTLTSQDRRNFIWEFALELEGSYVTGCIKLRTTYFERPEAPEREDSGPRERRPYGDRPSGGYQRRDSGDRPPRRDDDRPSGGGYERRDRDRPSGGGYQRRDSGGRFQKRDDDRPSGGGYQRRDGDRPSGGGYRGRSNDGPSRGGGGYKRSDGDRPSGGGYRGRPSGGPSKGRAPYKRRPKD